VAQAIRMGFQAQQPGRIWEHDRPRNRNSRAPERPHAASSSRKAFGLFQVGRVEALGNPAIDWSERLAGLIPLALIAPEPPPHALPRAAPRILPAAHAILIHCSTNLRCS